MTFDEVLEQVRDLLQSKSRVAYRALKRRFDLDEEYLEDLKAELIDAEHVACDEEGKVLVWTDTGSLASRVQRLESEGVASRFAFCPFSLFPLSFPVSGVPHLPQNFA